MAIHARMNAAHSHFATLLMSIFVAVCLAAGVCAAMGTLAPASASADEAATAGTIADASTTITTTVDTATSTDKTTIRVGCINTEGFTQLNDDGTVSGYLVDYLNKLTTYDNDLAFEYVFTDWVGAREMLLDHKVDLIYTRRNDDLPYDYAEEQLTVTLTALYARADDDNFYYDDYERLEGSEVGFLSQSFHATYFANYAACRGFTYEPVLFDSETSMLQALRTG